MSLHAPLGRPRSSDRRPASLLLDAGLGDDAAPARDLGGHEPAQLRRRARARLEAEIEKAARELGLGEHGAGFRVEGAITSAEVFTGTNNPFQVTTSKPGTPASCTEGTSGR